MHGNGVELPFLDHILDILGTLCKICVVLIDILLHSRSYHNIVIHGHCLLFERFNVQRSSF